MGLVLIVGFFVIIIFFLLNFWATFFFLLTCFGFLSRRLEVLLYVTLIFLLFHTPTPPFFKFSLRYLDIFLLLFILYYLFFYVENFKDIFTGLHQKKFLALFALAFFLMTLSQIQSVYITFPITTIHPGAISNYPFIKSSLRLLQVLFLFLFALCISHATHKISWKRMATMHTNIATTLSSFLLLTFFLNSFLPVNPLYNIITTSYDTNFIRLSGFFLEPIILSLYLLTSIPLLFASMTEQFSAYKVFGLFLQVSCLFLTYSRAGWLALFVITPFLFFFFFKEIEKRLSQKNFMGRSFPRRELGFVFILFFFFALIIILNYQPATDVVKQIFTEYVTKAVVPNQGKFWSTRLRLEAYSAAIDAFQKHPFFGIGIFNFHFYGGIKRYEEIAPGFYLNHSEVNNLFLSLLTELGIIGFLVLAYCGLLVFRHLYYLLKKGDTETTIRARGIFVVLIGIVIVMSFMSKYTYPFLWFFIGLTIALPYNKNS